MRTIINAAFVASFAFGLLFQPTAAQANSRCPPGQSPRYVFGFADLSSRLSNAMGSPVTCEFADPKGTGDIHQNTTRGLAFWRKSTNTPTFTNGSEHWALTSRGLVYWTGSSIDPIANAVVISDAASVSRDTPTLPPAASGAVGPRLDGLTPSACDWTTQQSIRVYFCIYPNDTSAQWQDQDGRWVLLARMQRGGEIVFTEDGRHAFGMTRPGDPSYKGIKPEQCSDVPVEQGTHRLCLYAGDISAAWQSRNGNWVLIGYKEPPATTYTFVTPQASAAPPAPSTGPITPSPAPRAFGTVVLKNRGCDYFVVESATGDFAVLEWFGGWEPDRGERVRGDWSHFGFVDIFNVSAGASTRVWVDDYGVSRTRALDIFGRRCS
jgi:hypothetical protein